MHKLEESYMSKKNLSLQNGDHPFSYDIKRLPEHAGQITRDESLAAFADPLDKTNTYFRTSIKVEDLLEDEDLVEHIGASLFVNGFPRNYKKAKEIFETYYLKSLLRETQGNVSEAARVAGKTRVEIYRFISRNNIDLHEFRRF